MSVVITSKFPVYAGGNTTITINAPNHAGYNVAISQVTGLQTALDGKLNDVLTQLGTNITTSGAELNLIDGLTANAAELNRMDGIVVSTSDLNSVTSRIPASTFTATNQLIVGTGVGTYTAQTVAATLGAASLSNLGAPTGHLSMATFKITNLGAPSADTDAATKLYVDTAVGGFGGPYLALAGGVMSGNIDMNGAADIVLDADGNSKIETGTDDTFLVVLGAVNHLTVNTTSINAHSKIITGVSDPSGNTDAATKGYTDTQLALKLNLAGGVLSGHLDLNGAANIILDADGNSNLSGATNDQLDVTLGGNAEYTFTTTTLNMRSNTITNLGAPSGGSDAATKTYVDNAITGITGFLPTAGGTMSGPLVIGNTYQELPNGTANAPSLRFTNATTTGIYRSAADTLGISAGGTLRASVSASGLVVESGRVFLPDSVAGSPGYTFTTDTDTGIANTAANTIALATSGTARLTLNTTAITAALPLNMGTNAVTNIGDIEMQAETLGIRQGAGASGSTYTLDVKDKLLARKFAIIFNSTAQTLAFNNTTTAMFTVDQTNSTFSVGTKKITNVSAPAASSDAATKGYVDTAVTGLSSTYLALAGGTMAGDINFNSNDITNLATINTNVTFNTTVSIGSATGGNSFLIRTTGTAAANAPSYSFANGTTSGMYHTGSKVALSYGGTDRLSVSASGVNAENQRITNVAAPTAGGDAVNLTYLNGLSFARVLGSVTTVNFAATGTTTVYTVPSGETHIPLRVIMRCTSFAATGGAVTDASVSVGANGSVNDVVSTFTFFGEIAAAGQVTFADASPGAAVLSGNSVVSVKVNTAAVGYSSFVFTVYVIGIVV